MTKEEAKQVFLNRGYVEVEGGTIYDPDKWREACIVISEWLEQEPCEDCISRQEAIDANCYNCSIKANGGKCSKCDAVKAIENLSSVKPQESCDVPDTNVGDLISREDAIKQCGFGMTSLLIADCLRKLPSATPQPKKGHWILTSDDDYEYCTCSECGYQNGENWMIGSQIKFCQECGAKMSEISTGSESEE